MASLPKVDKAAWHFGSRADPVLENWTCSAVDATVDLLAAAFNTIRPELGKHLLKTSPNIPDKKKCPPPFGKRAYG